MQFNLVRVVAWMACVAGCAPASHATGPTVISVRVSMPRQSATELDSAVSPVLEHALLGAPGLERIESTALPGRVTTVLWMKAAEPDAAMQAVQKRLAAAARMLPPGCPSPELMRGDPAAPPHYILALRSDTLPLTQVTELARIRVAQTLSMLAGVSKVEVIGGRDVEISVVPDADQMAARMTSPADLERCVTEAMRAAGDLTRQPEQDLSGVVVRTIDGQPVLLKDVARIETGATADGFARFDGAAAVLLAVSSTAGEPAIKELQQSLARIGSTLPASVQMTLLADLSTQHALVINLRQPADTNAGKREQAAAEVERIVDQMAEHPVAWVSYSTDEAATCRVLVIGDFTEQAAGELRTRLAQQPAVTASVRRVDNADVVNMALCGLDREQLSKWARAVSSKLRTDQILITPDSFPNGESMQLKFEIDRSRLAALGIDQLEVDAAVKFAGGKLTIRGAGGSVVSIRPSRTEPFDPSQLRGIQLHAAGGKIVPLSAVAKVSTALDPTALFRVNGFPAIRIDGAVPAGVSRATAISATLAAAAAERDKLGLPGEYRAIDLSDAPAK